MSRTRTLALVLAGGAGSRMGPLTAHRAKPALSFGGIYRLIDFPLSNCANSGISDVWVIQQYQPHSLEDHLSNGRPWDLDRTDGGLVVLHPFTGGEEEGFHDGNADALWRHRRLIGEFGAGVVLVVSSDAIYKLDYRDVIDCHLDCDADVTMVTTTVDDDPGRFGVVTVGAGGRVEQFRYKPDEPQGNLVTTEVFAYRPEALLDALEDVKDGDEHLADFGDSLLPRLVETGRAYEFRHDAYWRDVGTPESYWQAHQDLIAEPPGGIDLDDRRWPIRTTGARRPPARVAREASIDESLLSGGCRVYGTVSRSVLSPGVVVEPGASVSSSVVLHDAVIRSGAHVDRAIVDAGVDVRPRSGEPLSGGPTGNGVGEVRIISQTATADSRDSG